MSKDEIVELFIHLEAYGDVLVGEGKQGRDDSRDPAFEGDALPLGGS